MPCLLITAYRNKSMLENCKNNRINNQFNLFPESVAEPQMCIIPYSIAKYLVHNRPPESYIYTVCSRQAGAQPTLFSSSLLFPPVYVDGRARAGEPRR